MAMLGGKEALPGDCRLEGASIEHDRVLAHYVCATRPADIELRHPETIAPGAGPITQRFAVLSHPPAEAPPALVDAIATRIREREAGFVWLSSEAAPPTPPVPAPVPPEPIPVPWRRFHDMALLPLLFWLLRAKDRESMSTARRVAAILVFGSGTFAVAHGVLGCVGAAAMSVAFHRPLEAVSTLAVGLVASLVLGVLLVMSRSPVLPRGFARHGAAAMMAVGVWSLINQGGPPATGSTPFGRVLALRPHVEYVDTTPNRPRVPVRTNARGFRGPEVADRSEAGATRVVLIGDSFVFGSGIAWEETIGEALHGALAEIAPGRAFEMVNLGIGGDNLPSHVDVYEEATKTLHPDVVVLCLTMPNDLSANDDQLLRRSEAQSISFRATTWAFGLTFARFMWTRSVVSSAYTKEALAVLDRETLRLRGLRAGTDAPPLLVYAYVEAPELMAKTMGTLPGTRVVPTVPSDPSYWIPLDGHPTGAGNRAFAAALAKAIVALPAPQR
ncbi:Hypothetical protein A7982_01508 [Minicystis rosea]|nr:Hypothetical protein A7982_01508 [Minicystis rosea]